MSAPIISHVRRLSCMQVTCVFIWVLGASRPTIKLPSRFRRRSRRNYITTIYLSTYSLSSCICYGIILSITSVNFCHFFQLNLFLSYWSLDSWLLLILLLSTRVFGSCCNLPFRYAAFYILRCRCIGQLWSWYIIICGS